MREELETFVASLAIPADRKQVVLAELTDHVACAREAAVREGRDADAAERAALGNLEAMRASLERIEPAFRITRRRAIAHGVVAGALVAIAIEQLGTWLAGSVGGVLAIALAIVLAPPRTLDLLRAELRAPRIRGSVLPRGLPIGPALAYLSTIYTTPFLIWIAMIVVRRPVNIDVPWSAFALAGALAALLLVEGIRARRPAEA